MSKGGMQTIGVKSMLCDCGKETSRILVLKDCKISIHFTKKSIYWHIIKDGKIKRTFKQPNEWS